MMKIAVIGATGRAGNLIAREALRRGHEVTAIVRDASKLQHGLFPVIRAVSEKAEPPETEPDGRRRFVCRPNHELAGRVFHLVMDDGLEYIANFLDGQTVAWAGRGEPFVSQEYQCDKADSQVFMPSFFVRESGLHTCVTLVLDLEQSLVTMVKANIGLCPARSRLTSHRVVFGAIRQPGKPMPTVRHGYTAELVGKRIAWQYSPAVRLTHLYISERYLRASLKNMPPIDAAATPEQRMEIEDRAKRWSGGGDLLFVINTVLMQDFIRSIDMSVPHSPTVTLHSARGEWIPEPDEMESMPSPYRS